jgi:enamine deaminase RidA (YjgF/YER057c/UK114 family)
VTGGHRFLNPEGLLPGRGFSHVAVPAAGQVHYFSGQTAQQADGSVRGRSLAEQFDAAAANLVTALSAAGARPEHLVAMQIFVTDIADYRASLDRIGPAWRNRFGKHYPAMAVYGVPELFEPQARIELLAVAVVPDGG